MTTATPPPQPETSPARALVDSVRTGLMQGEVYQRTVWAGMDRDFPFDSRVVEARANFEKLTAYIAELESQLALTERDFGPLKTGYGVLREFVESVRDVEIDRNIATALLIHQKQTATALLEKVAEESKKPSPTDGG